MTTTGSTFAYVPEQLSRAGPIYARKMFGAYGLLRDGKTAAVICDEQPYLRPTPQRRQFSQGVPEAPPISQAKPYLFVDGDRLERGDWVSALFRRTTENLSAPKPWKISNLKAPR